MAIAVAFMVLMAAPTVPTGAAGAAAVGNDISYPQCGKALPASAAFGIVGVNGGKASNFNPCFATQLNWAKGLAGSTSQPPASVYVNTGNPGDVYVTNPSLVSYWPKTGTNAFGECSGGNDAACAYEYGRKMAEQDVGHVRQVDASTVFTYWLDVEITNSWSTNTFNNQADLIGMVDYFHSVGAPVGLYSTAYQFRSIAGTAIDPAGPLAGLDSWLAGARNLAGAKKNCSLPPLTPDGRVALTQYVSGSLDYDYPCT